MASNRKKQDEKHLKILRNLVSLPSNKQCFDCLQRGPTYVNTTIGSFVCTSCSGLLRGLTPPHRVKSISMATFTSEEIESLKTRGNEYCRKVWLATYAENHIQDTKDDQRVKEFMVAKYEKKRYYMEPSVALKNSNGVGSHAASPPWATSRSSGSHDRGQSTVPASSPFYSPRPHPQPQAQTPPSQISLNMFSSPEKITADPFGPVTPVRSAPSQQPPQISPAQQPSFANFDNNPVFSAAPTASPPLFSGLTTSASFPSAMKPAPEDKYAALKDLDSEMKMRQETQIHQHQQQQLQAQQQTQPTKYDWPTGNNGWSELNPFQTELAGPGCNPFRSGLVQENNINVWGGLGTMPTSQSMPLGNNWANSSNVRIGSGNSSNPFL